jgi:hypothetical protein
MNGRESASTGNDNRLFQKPRRYRQVSIWFKFIVPNRSDMVERKDHAAPGGGRKKPPSTR